MAIELGESLNGGELIGILQNIVDKSGDTLLGSISAPFVDDERSAANLLLYTCLLPSTLLWIKGKYNEGFGVVITVAEEIEVYNYLPNRTEVIIGAEMVKYARLKGSSSQFMELPKCKTLTDFFGNYTAMEEAFNDEVLMELLMLSDYTRKEILSMNNRPPIYLIKNQKIMSFCPYKHDGVAIGYSLDENRRKFLKNLDKRFTCGVEWSEDSYINVTWSGDTAIVVSPYSSPQTGGSADVLVSLKHSDYTLYKTKHRISNHEGCFMIDIGDDSESYIRVFYKKYTSDTSYNRASTSGHRLIIENMYI